MPATFYKLWTGGWGEPIGVGVMGARHVGVAGLAKTFDNDQPFAVVSEFICGHLGRALLLPVPPGFLLRKDDQPYHVSMDFNLSGQQLPPADAAALVAEHPGLALGIVVFDMWVLNMDRHEGNIAFDTFTKQVAVFDHSHALMPGVLGPEYMVTRLNELVVTPQTHCIPGHVTSLAALNTWCDKIDAVPEFFVREIFQQARDVGLPDEWAGPCAEFLLARRTLLRSLLRDNIADVFPNAEPDLITEALVSTGGEASPEGVQEERLPDEDTPGGDLPLPALEHPNQDDRAPGSGHLAQGG